jgi:hypothetical protein
MLLKKVLQFHVARAPSNLRIASFRGVGSPNNDWLVAPLAARRYAFSLSDPFCTYEAVAISHDDYAIFEVLKDDSKPNAKIESASYATTK